MIQLADEAIRALFEREAFQGADVAVAFDAPSEEWSERRNAPTVDVFLFDIRENPKRQMAGKADLRNGDGRVMSRARPPRWFNLSYVVTAWAQRPEDEHRILASLLQCLARHDVIPKEFLSEDLADVPVHVQVAQARPDGQGMSEVWSTLGRRWKASLELVVTIPVDLDAEIVAPLVTQPPVAHVTAIDRDKAPQ